MLEAGVGDLRDGKLFVVSLLGRDDWCIGDQGEVDPGVGHQVGLEFSQIHVQGSIKSQGSSDRRHNLSDQPVQDGVVGLDHSSGDLRCGVDGELKLALLAVVHGQPLHEKGSKARSGASSEGVEEKESLESSAGICQLPDPVKNKVDNLLSDGVVSSGVVVGGILLSIDQLLGVVELTVCSASGLVDDSGLQIDEDRSWDVLASTGL